MGAVIVDFHRRWHYVSSDPPVPTIAEIVQKAAELVDAHDRSVALAKRKAAAPLKPIKPQEPCDHGLFSDEAKQVDLMDLTRATQKF